MFHPVPPVVFLTWVALCLFWTAGPGPILLWVKIVVYFVVFVPACVEVILRGKQRKRMRRWSERAGWISLASGLIALPLSFYV